MVLETPEYLFSEKPTIAQLTLPSMGWRSIKGDINDPQITGRESFKQVLLLRQLKDVIHCINLDDAGNP